LPVPRQLDTILQMPDNLYIFVNWACAAVLASVLLKKLAPNSTFCRPLFTHRMRPARLAVLTAILAIAGAEFARTTLYEPMFQRAEPGDSVQLPSASGQKLPHKLPKSLDFAEYWLGSKDLALGNNLYRDMAGYIHFRAAQFRKEGRQVPMARYSDWLPTDREGFQRLDRLSRKNGIPVFPYFTYPPTWYVLFTPFTSIDWRDAHDIWLVANLVFVAGAIALALLAIGYRPGGIEETLALITLVVGYSPLVFALKECQANSLVLLIVCAALYLASRGKNAAAGALIALGAAVKVFPGILLLYFLWKRKFRLAAWGFICLLIIMAASVAAVGWEVHYWYFFKVAPTWASNMRAFDMNQSLAGVVSRALVGGEGIRPIAHRPRLARASITLLQTALLAIALWVTRGRASRFNSRVWLEVGLVIVFYQLASTWVLIHHLEWLLIPFLFVWGMSRGAKTVSPWLWCSLGASYVLTGVRYVYWREAFRAEWMALLASLKSFGMLVLFLALAVWVWRLRREQT